MARPNVEIRKHPNFENAVHIGMFKGLVAWASLVVQKASEKAPVDTGRLARSIGQGAPFLIDDFVMAIEVGTNVEYARAIEFGSGLFSTNAAERDFIIIRPKNKKALAFFWPNGPQDHAAYDPESGKFVFSQVKHPGVQPQPFLTPALMETRREGQQLVWSAILAEISIL